MSHYYTVKEAVKLLREEGFCIKNGDDVYYTDVYKAFHILKSKHPYVKWVVYDNMHPLITETGLEWIKDVYFNNVNSQKENDIIFFELKINDMISFCKENHIKYKIKELFYTDVSIDNFVKVVRRKKNTCKKIFSSLPNELKSDSYYFNKKRYFTKSAANEICRRYFKSRYISYLEYVYCQIRKAMGDMYEEA